MLSNSDLIAQTHLMIENSRRELDRIQEAHTRFRADIAQAHAFLAGTQAEEKAAWLKNLGYIPSFSIEDKR
jgi:hypothetical protein